MKKKEVGDHLPITRHHNRNQDMVGIRNLMDRPMTDISKIRVRINKDRNKDKDRIDRDKGKEKGKSNDKRKRKKIKFKGNQSPSLTKKYTKLQSNKI